MRARTRSSPATSRWTCSRSASARPAELTHLPRAGVLWAGPSWVDDAVAAGHPWEREAEAGRARRCPRRSRRGPAGSCTSTTSPPRTSSGRAGATAAAASAWPRAASRAACGTSRSRPITHGWPRHCHAAEEELFVILSGTGTVRIGDEEAPVRAGHVVSRPPGTGLAHSFRAGPDGLEYLVLRPAREQRHRLLPRLGQVLPGGRGCDRARRAARLLGRGGRPGLRRTASPRLRSWASRSTRATGRCRRRRRRSLRQAEARAYQPRRAGAAGGCASAVMAVLAVLAALAGARIADALDTPGPARARRSGLRLGGARRARGSPACRSRCSAGARAAAPGSRVSACRAGSPIRASRSRSAPCSRRSRWRSSSGALRTWPHGWWVPVTRGLDRARAAAHRRRARC